MNAVFSVLADLCGWPCVYVCVLRVSVHVCVHVHAQPHYVWTWGHRGEPQQSHGSRQATKKSFTAKNFSASETIIDYFKWVLTNFN